MLLRENRRASSHPANQRQGQLRKGVKCLLVHARAHRGRLPEPDAARRAADQLKDAFACERLQVLLGGVGRAESQFACNFGSRGRCACGADGALNQFQNLLLAGGQFDAVVHVPLHFLRGADKMAIPVYMSSNCIFKQFSGFCKGIQRKWQRLWFWQQAAPLPGREQTPTMGWPIRRPRLMWRGCWGVFAACRICWALICCRASRWRKSTARIWIFPYGRYWPGAAHTGWHSPMCAPYW